MPKAKLLHLALLVSLSALASNERSARADEGMWPFNMIPKEAIEKAHGVKLDDAWLDRVRLASVRFNSGGSGSFISKTGLVLTNHHVASDCIAKLASGAHDYLETGYLAGKDGPEARCPDLELNVLEKIEDVTAQVVAARGPGMNDADANTAIKGKMSEIEKACTDNALRDPRRGETALRCDVVTLYAGGRYDLYSYKKYTDVRLVFAPEQSLAFFGGDPDNFTYPRFDLDMAIFRVYEAGKAIAPQAYLPWSPAGPKDGETVFVSGHPGSTGRMMTLAQLGALRDTVYPYYLDAASHDRAALLAFGKDGTEATREIREPMFGLENGLKAIRGFEGGLKDAALMKHKADDEAALRKAIDADPTLKAKYGAVFGDVEKVQAKIPALYKRYAILEGGLSRTQLLGIARDLLRLPHESELANEKRLREYRSSNLDSLKLRMFSPAAIYGGVEVAFIEEWMKRAVRDLGMNDPAVRAMLACTDKAATCRTPARAARELVVASKLFDVNARRKLEAGGKAAVEASDDPAIVLVRAIDQDARAVRKRYEDEVEGPMRSAGEKIAQAVFAVRGASIPPDATFTLRLSVGVVKGYTEAGKPVPWACDYAGMYKHATGKDPLKLPQRWVDKKSDVQGDVPLNFVSTNDIIGGNSGSPVINAKGEIVGLIFDGNLTSLPNRFVYGETTQRAVSVDTAGMSLALNRVYGADALLAELSAR